jgi:tetratricopeptide (TPR) repeat protein
MILGERLIGISKHYAGYQKEAFAHLSEMLTRYDREQHRLAMLGSSIDHRIVAQATVARILWLQGERDKALALSEQALSGARDEDHDMTVCYVLVESAIPLALLSGKRERAKAAITLLQVIANRAGLTIWQVCGRCYDEYLSAESDGSPTRLRTFREALDALEKIDFMAHAGLLYGGYAIALAKAGRIAEGLGVVERALAHCDEAGEHWYCGELRRLQGELLLMEQASAHAEGDAHACFNAAMEEALLQGSRSFQLRAATSIASLWQASDRACDIANFLIPVCSQLSEGLDFDDYDAATSLLSKASSIARDRDESNCESA